MVQPGTSQQVPMPGEIAWDGATVARHRDSNRARVELAQSAKPIAGQ
jgi:hypothetical protein